MKEIYQVEQKRKILPCRIQAGGNEMEQPAWEILLSTKEMTDAVSYISKQEILKMCLLPKNRKEISMKSKSFDADFRKLVLRQRYLELI